MWRTVLWAGILPDEAKNLKIQMNGSIQSLNLSKCHRYACGGINLWGMLFVVIEEKHDLIISLLI